MEYTKCLVELDEVINHLDEECLLKIPLEIREGIKDKKDKEYGWKYDETKELSEQNLDRRTIAMLSYLNMEFLLNDEQRKIMEELHTFNEQKLEKEKMEKYNIDDIFKNNMEKQEKIEKEKNALIDVKKEKWYEKIYSFIKGILK